MKKCYGSEVTTGEVLLETARVAIYPDIAPMFVLNNVRIEVLVTNTHTYHHGYDMGITTRHDFTITSKVDTFDYSTLPQPYEHCLIVIDGMPNTVKAWFYTAIPVYLHDGKVIVLKFSGVSHRKK